MKKEINSKSKRKWVAGGLAAFASIALLTTGFATWVVGKETTSDDKQIGVTVDTAKNVNVEFVAELQSGESIRLAETSNSASSTDFVKADENPSGDLKITFTTLKISYGAESGFNVTGKKLKFSITDHLKVSAPSADVFGREGTELTYIEAPAAIDLDETNGESASANGVTTYTFTTLTFNFKWGTFFGTEGQSPLEFYNSKFNADPNPVAKTSANAQKVVDELNGMRDAYAAKNKIELHLEIAA